MTIKVVVEKELSLDLLAGVMTSAFEGGVGYWCCIVDYKHPPGGQPTNEQIEEMFGKDWEKLYKHCHYPLIEGAAVVVEDTEDDEKTYELTLDKVKAGLKVLGDKYPRHLNDIVDENYDAETGDVLVQCALFGEVVYG